jgi:DNA-binding transcriptional MerR regulator
MQTNTTINTIGKVARAVGIGVETVCFYERKGLIPELPRSTAGYRLYPSARIQRLQFITRAKALGFTLAEVGELLSMSAAPEAGCGDVRDRAKVKIAEIDGRISQLLAHHLRRDGELRSGRLGLLRLRRGQ